MKWSYSQNMKHQKTRFLCNIPKSLAISVSICWKSIVHVLSRTAALNVSQFVSDRCQILGDFRTELFICPTSGKPMNNSLTLLATPQNRLLVECSFDVRRIFCEILNCSGKGDQSSPTSSRSSLLDVCCLHQQTSHLFSLSFKHDSLSEKDFRGRSALLTFPRVCVLDPLRWAVCCIDSRRLSKYWAHAANLTGPVALSGGRTVRAT